MPTFTTFTGSKSGDIVKTTISRAELLGDQLYIRVTASGLCGTDLHFLHSAGCLGHEGCGVVEAIGPDVKQTKVGDRVGFGYLRNACGYCDQCISGDEIFCPKRDTYETPSDVGSLASHAVWREAFVFAIPKSIADENAAPLMCGGATVFTALSKYNVAPTETVGIVGVGGLGHLAIQFAAKMGCDVTVFSGTDSKKDETLSLGASDFIATKGIDKIDIGEKRLNRLLVTTSSQPDWDIYMPIMAPGGTIFIMGVSPGNLTLPYKPIILQGLRLQGSLVASRQEQRRMFDFAARHDIKPIINKFPLTVDGIQKGIEALKSGKMRYRGVLVP